MDALFPIASLILSLISLCLSIKNGREINKQLKKYDSII